MSKIYIGVDEAHFKKESSLNLNGKDVQEQKPHRVLEFKINGTKYSLAVVGEVEILAEKEVANKLSMVNGFRPGDDEYKLYALQKKDKKDKKDKKKDKKDKKNKQDKQDVESSYYKKPLINIWKCGAVSASDLDPDSAEEDYTCWL